MFSPNFVNILLRHMRVIALYQSHNLQTNDYWKQEIAGTIKHYLKPRPKPENNDSHKWVVFLSYINGIADGICKLLHKHCLSQVQSKISFSMKKKCTTLSSESIYKFSCS